MEDRLHIDSMVDCVQLESSSVICSVIGQLVAVIQKTRTLTSPNEQPTSANQAGSGDASSHEYANEGRSHKNRGRLKKILENTIFNLKVTSINVFATNDIKGNKFYIFLF